MRDAFSLALLKSMALLILVSCLESNPQPSPIAKPGASVDLKGRIDTGQNQTSLLETIPLSDAVSDKATNEVEVTGEKDLFDVPFSETTHDMELLDLVSDWHEGGVETLKEANMDAETSWVTEQIDQLEVVQPDLLNDTVSPPLPHFAEPQGLVPDFENKKTGGNLPVIKIDKTGGIHVAWRQKPMPDLSIETIFYRHKPPDGDWEPVEIVEQRATKSVLFPSGMAVGSDGTVVVTWAEDRGEFDEQGNEYCEDIYYRIRDPLVGWGEVQTLIKLAALAWPDCSQTNPDVAIDSQGGLHFVWQDERNDPPEGEVYIIPADIYYRYTPTGDEHDFGQEVRLTEVTQGSVNPRIAIGPFDEIHVVWASNHDEPGPDKYWIYYRNLENPSGEWGPIETVKWAYHGLRTPQVSQDNAGMVHVAWLERKAPLIMDIHYKHRGYDVYEWSEEEIAVSNDFPKGGVSRGFYLASDQDSGAHIVWHQNNSSLYPDDGYAAYYTFRPWNWWPQEWTEPTLLNKETSGDQKNPSVAVGLDGLIRCVWEDGSQGLYYEFNNQLYPRLNVFYSYLVY